jgi:hypothetical protein
LDVSSDAIEQYCRAINRVCAASAAGDGDADPGAVEWAGFVENDGEGHVLERVRECLKEALAPTSFETHEINRVNHRFWQCYELLRQTFSEAELSPEWEWTEQLRGSAEREDDCPPIMLSRSFQVSGRHVYDRGGRLTSFGFDPLTVTDGIVSVVSGSYMSLAQVGRPGLGIGVMGYLATRERFRGGGGHGSALVRAFEERAAALASGRGERLLLIALEAATGSTGFWAKRGFRWPEGTQYFQPPLEYDPVTGAPRHREVPELLMVKLRDQPDAQVIETALLRDVVQTVFRNWYSAWPASFTPQATEQATAYVWQHVFPRFTVSLRPASVTSLQEPPHPRDGQSAA